MNVGRRAVLAAGASFICAPLMAVAQPQGKVWRVGFLALNTRPPSLDADPFGAFVRGMRELGYVDGKNLAMEWRFAAGSTERMAAMAAELAQIKVDVIATWGVPPASAAQKATATIPIVMATATDPLGTGLVKSLARPGGNITGLSNATVDISTKHLGMLLDVNRRLTRVAVLLNPDTASHRAVLESLKLAAQKASITLVPAEARTLQEIDQAFSQFVRETAAALFVPLAPLFIDQRREIAERALKNRLPSISGVNGYAEAGGLMSYGQPLADHAFRAATYVDKIFKEAKPGDLPIEEATRFESAINQKTAKALGLTISQQLLLQVNKVIE